MGVQVIGSGGQTVTAVGVPTKRVDATAVRIVGAGTGGGGGGPDLSNTAPQDLGTAAAGVSTEASRADHVHGMPTAGDVGAAAASHNHDASAINTGTVGTARLGSGTANSTTYLRGDQTWATVSIPGIPGFYEDNIYSGLQATLHTQFGGGGQAATVGADLLVLWRIMPVETVDVDGAMFLISTSGTAGALARVGIYAASATTTGPTGAPLCDTAGLDVTPAGGTEVAATFTPVRLTAWTPYWGFMLSNNATFQPRLLASAANTVAAVRLDVGQVSSSNHLIRRVAATYGTPPTNPSAPFVTAVITAPGVLWRTQRI